MKKFIFISLRMICFFTFAVLLSCSSDDDDNNVRETNPKTPENGMKAQIKCEISEELTTNISWKGEELFPKKYLAYDHIVVNFQMNLTDMEVYIIRCNNKDKEKLLSFIHKQCILNITIIHSNIETTIYDDWYGNIRLHYASLDEIVTLPYV